MTRRMVSGCLECMFRHESTYIIVTVKNLRHLSRHRLDHQADNSRLRKNRGFRPLTDDILSFQTGGNQWSAEFVLKVLSRKDVKSDTGGQRVTLSGT